MSKVNERKKPELKPLFIERIKQLLTKEEDFKAYLEILKQPPVRSIRCNTLKIAPEELKNKLEAYNWKITQPFTDYPEVMIIEGKSLVKQSQGKLTVKEPLGSLQPGELGRALEHLLGYYYIQELASMLPVMVLEPKEDELILDLCAAPGSKTTQIAAKMKNTGTIIANEVSLGRIKILAANTERCGVTNTILTKKDGMTLCNRLRKQNIQVDRILLDAPCSGEGTLRSSYKTYSMWNPKTITTLSKIQKNLFESAFNILKQDGTIIYSTCTHAPEENEEIVNFALETFKDQIKIETIKLPIPTRKGITKWQEKEYAEDVQLACRVYPHVANTEGFFLAKFTKLK